MDRYGPSSPQNAYMVPTQWSEMEKGCRQNRCNPLFLLACPEGFEPPTVGLEGPQHLVAAPLLARLLSN